MKTLFAVVLYAAFIGVLNLGGVVWHNWWAGRSDKAAVPSVALPH